MDCRLLGAKVLPDPMLSFLPNVSRAAGGGGGGMYFAAASVIGRPFYTEN